MIERERIEYNRRQITLMESRVKLYRNDQISIKAFIDDIDALIAWIQNPPSHWVVASKGLLWEIEIIYATALAHKEVLTKEKLQQIAVFVDKIEDRVIWYKQNCLPPVNDDL